MLPENLGPRHERRQALIGSLIEQATQRDRLTRIEVAIDAIREMLTIDDAEWLAKFDSRRDERMYLHSAERLQTMLACLPRATS